MKITFLIASLLTLAACSHQVVVNPCGGDLTQAEMRNSCHDDAFHRLKTDRDWALGMLRQLCEEHSLARACSNLGYAYVEEGVPSREDLALGKAFYAVGCNLGDGIACNNLANIYFLGKGVPVDKREGFDLLKKGCDASYAVACYREAQVRMAGVVVERNLPLAAELMAKACGLSDGISCNDLGNLYLSGEGVERDLVAASELFEKSCKLGTPRGCGNYGYLYSNGENKDYAKAYEYQLKACQLDDGPSCGNLGYLLEEGKGVEKNPARAAEFYLKSCKLGDGFNCGNLGLLQVKGLGIPKDEKFAFAFLERGCSERNGEACRFVASYYEQGTAGIKHSRNTASQFRLRACEAGDEPSCTKLAEKMSSLCGKKEATVLSCITGEHRTLSLCEAEEKLIYRFGSSKRMELKFQDSFAFLESQEALVRFDKLTFVLNGTVYEVRDSWDNGQDPPLRSVGIRVTEDEKATQIECKKPIKGDLAVLKNKKLYNVQK